MVAWVFAGGGDSEIRGLMPFLRMRFSGYDFERKTPVRQKRGPKPGVKIKDTGMGKTGKSLARQITRELDAALRGGNKCDLILVVDDLDCCCPEERYKLLQESVSKIPEAIAIQCIIAFAAPEIESWIIADWDNTVAKHIDFRNCAKAMQHWLSKERGVLFADPESFGEYDTQLKSCSEKLSDQIIEASLEHGARNCYSKGTHTPLLLREIDPATVAIKCRWFRNLYNEMLGTPGKTVG